MPLNNSQLKKYRPFQGKTKDELDKEVQSSLKEYVTAVLDNKLKRQFATDNPVTLTRGPNLEIPTLILEELRQRKLKKKNFEMQREIMNLIANVEDQIIKKPLKPIPWLVEARHRIRSISKETTKKTGIYCVYVIRLVYETKRGGLAMGAYVGQSKYEPNIRFKNHIKGNKYEAIRAPNQHGQEVLYSLTPHLKNMSEDESIRLEIKVRKILEGCDGLSFLKGGEAKKQSVLQKF